jgi:protein-L-isoaspartate(D-aspartate) O-methyltransferase
MTLSPHEFIRRFLMHRAAHISTGGRARSIGIPSSARTRIERRGEEFFATRISGVAIFPCEGGRDEASEAPLRAAFEKRGSERVTRLYRRDDLPEERCWLRAPGWCLAYESTSPPALREMCPPNRDVTLSAI